MQRRLFLAGVLSALGLRPPRTAQADTTFTDFRFTARGAPTARTLPDRLSDVQNVKDWGALGRGSHDDTSAIQGAIDHCIKQGTDGHYGGTVFFPPGKYKVSSLAVGTNDAAYSRAGVRIVGSGRECTVIEPHAANWAISSGGRTYECIETIENIQLNAGRLGSIQITGSNIRIVSVRFNGKFGIDATQANGAYIADCSGLYSGPNSADAGPGYGQAFLASGSIGIALGNNCIAYDCRPGLYDVDIALSGYGANALSCSGDNANIGFRMGWGVSASVAAEIPAVGCTIQGGQTEQTNVSYELYNCDSCAVFAGRFGGNAGLPVAVAVTGAYAAGTVTITTATNHNIGANGTHVILQIANPSKTDYIPNYGSGNAVGLVAATVTADNRFTYALSPAPASNTLTSATWTYPLSYGYRARNVKNTLIVPGEVTSNVVVTVDLDYGGEANIVQNNNVIMGVDANQGWVVPRGVNKAAWKYIQVRGGTNILASDVISKLMPFNAALPSARVSYPDATMNYADLPGQGGVNQSGPFEGQEYIIVDSNIAASGNWNATVSGGGGNHVKVRYDSTGTPGWRISG